MRKLFMMIVLVLVTGLFAAGQTVQITGVVTSSEDGLPMPGVTVKVQGTTIGASTGIDGSFFPVSTHKCHRSRILVHRDAESGCAYQRKDQDQCDTCS